MCVQYLCGGRQYVSRQAGFGLQSSQQFARCSRPGATVKCKPPDQLLGKGVRTGRLTKGGIDVLRSCILPHDVTFSRGDPLFLVFAVNYVPTGTVAKAKSQVDELPASDLTSF